MVKNLICEYVILGIPVPWAAPKFSHCMAYDIRKKAKEEIIEELKALKSSISIAMIDFPIHVDFCFEMPMPASWPKKKKLAVMEGNRVWHSSKPDRSNMTKLYEDCLERAGIIKNDSLIVSGDSRKYYSDTPRVLIFILRT